MALRSVRWRTNVDTINPLPTTIATDSMSVMAKSQASYTCMSIILFKFTFFFSFSYAINLTEFNSIEMKWIIYWMDTIDGWSIVVSYCNRTELNSPSVTEIPIKWICWGYCARRLLAATGQLLPISWTGEIKHLSIHTYGKTVRR